MPVLNPEAQHPRASNPPPANGPYAPPLFAPALRARLRAAAVQAAAELDALANRPAAFFLALLALNAFFLPYGGFRQDARLYAFQVMNVLEEGRYADDLFFHYGSQDRYSVFSLVAAPLIRLTGIPLGFFLLFLVSNALFLFAVLRFVRAVVPDRGVATWALLFLAVTRVPFGGSDAFFVGENFFTPRLPACALVLLGLERLLAGRPAAATTLLVLAFLLHPLMALGGCLILLGWGLVYFLPWRGVLLTLGGAAAVTAAVLVYEPLGARLLGRMDAEWFELIRRVNSYQVPAEWSREEWLRVVTAGATLFAAWRCSGQEPRVQRFLIILLAVSVLGLGGAVLACLLPYALPLQGQPYRVLWLTQMLQVPLGLHLLGRWCKSEAVPAWAAALGAAGCLGLLSFSLIEWLPLLVAAGLFAVYYWAAPRSEDLAAAWPSLAWCLCAGLAAWIALQVGVIVRHWHEVAGLVDPVEFPRSLSQQLSPLVRVLAGAAAILLAARALEYGAGLPRSLLAVWLTAHLVCFALPFVPAYAGWFHPHREELETLRQRFADGRPDGRPYTVYWPIARLEYVWLQLRVNCYLDIAQLSGNSFARGTAVEGERRLALAKPFEIDCYRRHRFVLNDLARHLLRELFQGELHEVPPTRDDLLRLCQDPLLDFVVARQGFDDLYTATHGAWFLYDCRHVRLALATGREDEP